MEEKRATTRRRVLKAGRVIIGPKAPALECTVRNVSDGGALLQLSSTYGIPATFELILDGRRRTCRVAWRTDAKIGVAFID